ncbi:MAG: NTP transferase domain-containing protein [Gemmatimonadetes bacterium]|nr:NTP transferase domain-containing protein [Gemmatimonadota bacterium]
MAFEGLILAAGEGRRLRPLTDTVPKALVRVAGAPLLAHVARSLVAAGSARLVVTAHSLAEQVQAWVDQTQALTVIRVSREDRVADKPLETGGGILHAWRLMEGTAPFVVHNADVLSDINLKALYRAHLEGEAQDGRLATLAVLRRPTKRPLIVDARGVAGLRTGLVRSAEGPTDAFGFLGVHVISHRLPAMITERGAFSIFGTYMRLIRGGERIAVYEAAGARWFDIGTPERLAAARGSKLAESLAGTLARTTAAKTS